MKAKVNNKVTVKLELSAEEFDLLCCVLSYTPANRAPDWGHSSSDLEHMRDVLCQVKV